MDGLSSESEAQKPAEEQKPVLLTKDTKDTKSTAKPKKPRVAREKLPPATADVPAAAAPPAVDAAFFGKLGSTLRDLKREAKTQKFSNFVVA